MLSKHRIAKLISAVLNPFTLTVFIQLFIFFYLFENFVDRKTILILLTIQAIIPFVLMLIFMKLKLISDFDITNRRERTLYFTILIFLILFFSYILIPFLPSEELLLIPIMLGITLFFMVLINIYWKISGHMAFDTILFLALGRLINPYLLLLLALLPLVAWSRIVQKKHTLLQTIGGSILGATIFILVLPIVPKIYELDLPYLINPTISSVTKPIEINNSPAESRAERTKETIIDKKVEEISKPNQKTDVDIKDDSLKNSPTNSKPSQSTQNWWEYPDQIVEVTKDPNDLLVLINKKYKLPSTYAPSDLVNLGNTGLRYADQKQGRKIIVEDLKSLAQAAKEDGIDLAVKSAYRSYATQQSTYSYWVGKEGGNSSEADKYSARPGHSQHQLGTTIDFTSKESSDNIGSVFHNTKAAKWLEDNAWRYGFVISYPKGSEEVTGYTYESWHYRYIGVENAKSWKESDLILDQWLEKV